MSYAIFGAIVLGLYLAVRLRRSMRRHGAVTHAFLAKHTYSQLDEAERKAIRDHVPKLLGNSGLRPIPGEEAGTELDGQPEIVKYCFYGLAMGELGIPPGVPGEQWRYVKNPFFAFHGANHQIRVVQHHFKNKLGLDVEFAEGENSTYTNSTFRPLATRILKRFFYLLLAFALIILSFMCASVLTSLLEGQFSGYRSFVIPAFWVVLFFIEIDLLRATFGRKESPSSYSYLSFLLLPVATAVLMAFVTENKEETRWPDALSGKLDIANRRNSPRLVMEMPEIILPRAKSRLAVDLASAYFLYVFQRAAVESANRHHPQAAKKLVLAQLQFEAEFEKSFSNIERIAKELDVETVIDPQNASLLREVSEEDYGVQNILLLADEIEGRTSGNMLSEPFGTLLSFHPTYNRFPHLETASGFRREYHSDGTGKSHGLVISLTYPASWKAQERKGPLVVQSFNSWNGLGPEIIVLTVEPAKSNAEKAAWLPTKHVAEFLFQELSESGVVIDMSLVDFGAVEVASQRAVWIETEQIVEIDGGTVECYALDFYLDYKGRKITIHFVCFPRDETETAFDNYRRNALLFMQIVSTIEINSK